MTFGLLDAAFTLSAAIGTTLDECKEYAGVYYDDIIVHSPDLETHFQQVDSVLDKLAERGLRINYAKCEFIKESVKFVGLTVSGAGISPSPAKVDKIVKFETPSNIESLRAFMGMAGFYRRFIPLFSIKSAPLFALFKRENKFIWTQECQKKAFEYIKQHLSSPDLLIFPDFSRPFILQTDASETGLGFVMGHEVEGILRPIMFGGRVLTKSEARYAPTDRELLGIYYTVRKCMIYLLGQQYVVYTDHKPLTNLLVLSKNLWSTDTDGLRFLKKCAV